MALAVSTVLENRRSILRALDYYWITLVRQEANQRGKGMSEWADKTEAKRCQVTRVFEGLKQSNQELRNLVEANWSLILSAIVDAEATWLAEAKTPAGHLDKDSDETISRLYQTLAYEVQDSKKHLTALRDVMK
jgi:hypothetical protein